MISAFCLLALPPILLSIWNFGPDFCLYFSLQPEVKRAPSTSLGSAADSCANDVVFSGPLYPHGKLTRPITAGRGADAGVRAPTEQR